MNSAFRLLSPILNQYQHTIIMMMSHKLPFTLQAAHLSVRWNGYQPIVQLNGVTLRGQTDHNICLHASQMQMTYSFMHSLFTHSFMPSKIVLDGLTIQIQSTTLAGIPELSSLLQGSFGPASPMTTAPLPLSNHVVTHSMLTALIASVGQWMDIPSLVLRNMDIRVSRQGGQLFDIIIPEIFFSHSNDLQHTIIGQLKVLSLQKQAVAPQPLPLTIALSIRWFGHVLDRQHITVESDISLKHLSLETSPVSDLLHALLVHRLGQWSIQKGSGWVRVWMRWEQGNWQWVRSHVKLSHLEWLGADQKQTQVIQRLNGELSWKRQGMGHLITGEHCVIELANHRFPETHFTLLLQPSAHTLTQSDWKWGIQKLYAENRDVWIHCQGDITQLAGRSPWIDLRATFAISRMSQIAHYLPLRYFNPHWAEWFKHAFLSGQVSSGQAIVRGFIHDFPFSSHKGTFLLRGQAEQWNLKFASNWPILSQANAEVSLSAQSLQATIQKGDLLGIPINQVKVIIPDFSRRDAKAILQIQVPNVAMGAKQAMDFIHSVPVFNRTIGKILLGLQLDGPLQLRLNLYIPLLQAQQMSLNGQVTLHKVQLNWLKWYPLTLTDLEGNIQFTRSMIRSNSLQGNYLNRPIALKIRSVQASGSPARREDRQTVITCEHLVKADDLQQWVAGSIVSHFIQGETKVQTTITLSNTQISLDHPTVHIQLKSFLQGMTLFLPNQYAKAKEESRLLMMQLVAHSGKFLQLRLQYDDLLAYISPGFNFWKIELASQDILGTLILSNVLAKPAQPISLHFKKMKIRSMPLLASWSHDSGSIAWSLFPAMVFSADQMIYQHINWGQVKATVFPSQHGLEIRSLYLLSPTMQCRAKGSIKQSPNRFITLSLQGTAGLSQVGPFLANFGVNTQNIILSTGKISFFVNIRNLLEPSWLSGAHVTASLFLNKGRVLEIGQSNFAELGLGRVLNLLSIQTVPRRLNLDFSDLLQKGYSFDYARGTLELTHGHMDISNMKIEGPVASMHIWGHIGLMAKDYNLVLSVTPYVTASLPVVATLVTGQPIIGLATWIVNKVMYSQLSKITTFYYTLTGPWDHPHWQFIKKSPI